MIANVMTVEYHRVGILGHVYTKLEHRSIPPPQLLFSGEVGGLLDSLDLPEGKLQAYVEVGAEDKAELLRQRGFALLRAQVRDREGRPLDVRIFCRGG